MDGIEVPRCPRCGDPAPRLMWTKRADDGRHWTYVWTCTECGHDFETTGNDKAEEG